MAGSVNIRDVAAMAGVSVATVSRTLKNPDLVRPATREEVLAAAAAWPSRVDFPTFSAADTIVRHPR